MELLNQVICGDCVEILEKVPEASIDLTLTSPPYDSLRHYKGYSFDFEQIARLLHRATKNGGVVVWIVNDATIKGDETGTSFQQVLYFKKIGFRLHDTMIYAKTGIRFPESNRYYPAFEFMFVLSKGRPITTNLIKDRPNKLAGQKNKSTMEPQPDGSIRRPNRRYVAGNFGVRKNIWEYSPGFKKTASDDLWVGHPAVFPLQLAADHIRSWSNEGETVLDPLCGSGQTLIAAKQLGRRFIGIDISPEYVDLARQRLAIYSAD